MEEITGVVTFDNVLSAANGMPEEIVFQAGDTWAIKITKDGIFSNPDVLTDEGAKAMFAALKPYLMELRKSGG